MNRTRLLEKPASPITNTGRRPQMSEALPKRGEATNMAAV